jgi:sugar phosphate isomerase/epimerase
MKTPPEQHSAFPQKRRRFLQCALAAAVIPPRRLVAADAGEATMFSKIGLAAGIDHAAALKLAGIDFLTVGVGGLLVPDRDEAAFDARRRELAEAGLPVMAVNSFIRPDHLKCVGPRANHDEVMDWARIVFRRAAACGVKFVVFGSSGTRRRPGEWTTEQADEQFISILKRMGPAAAEHEVTVVVEQLQPAECNFINHIAHAGSLVRGAAHPNIRLLADIFHMMRSGDGPETLRGVADVLAHVEIAEKEDRTVPGVSGDDFRPYFEVLREIGYRGPINMEGKWEIGQIEKAVATIRRQSQA